MIFATVAIYSIPDFFFPTQAVEISKTDYEPSDMDILYAEGITSSRGLSSVEFSFPMPDDDSYEHDEHDPLMRLVPFCALLISC